MQRTYVLHHETYSRGYAPSTTFVSHTRGESLLQHHTLADSSNDPPLTPASDEEYVQMGIYVERCIREAA